MNKSHNRIAVIFFLTLCISSFLGCTKSSISPANLSVQNISYTEILSSTTLDLENGVMYQPDNPNFDINDPSTWTGNMEQYVKHYRLYTVTFSLKNSGNSTAYDTEIDLKYLFDEGQDESQTVIIGDIGAKKTVSRSTDISFVNKKLVESIGEVFWYD